MTARLKDAIVELEARVQERDEVIDSLMEDLRIAHANLMMAEANISQLRRLLAYERGRVKGLDGRLAQNDFEQRQRISELERIADRQRGSLHRIANFAKRHGEPYDEELVERGWDGVADIATAALEDAHKSE